MNALSAFGASFQLPLSPDVVPELKMDERKLMVSMSIAVEIVLVRGHKPRYHRSFGRA